ncbi:putative biotin carboxylase [Helianthus anomalus]
MLFKFKPLQGIQFYFFCATTGGGGRGMRLAKERDEFVKLLQQALSEAATAFGNDGVYLEKCIQNPRHNEFQVFIYI